MGFDLRTKVASLLTADAPLAQLIPAEAMFQRTGMLMESPPNDRPFLVYHFGQEIPELGVESQDQHPTRRHVQVWVHDVIGDYFRIDQALDRVRHAFEVANVEGTFLELRFVERSQDLLDPELHTITRWSRFTATLTE